MMTSSNGNIFRVTGPLCWEFTGHRWIPRTKASDADLRCFLSSMPKSTVEHLQLKRWGFETPSCSLWRHCNDNVKYQKVVVLHQHQTSALRNDRKCEYMSQSKFRTKRVTATLNSVSLKPRQNGHHFADNIFNAFPWRKALYPVLWFKFYWSLLLGV